MSFAAALILRGGDRQRLADLARLPSVPSALRLSGIGGGQQREGLAPG